MRLVRAQAVCTDNSNRSPMITAVLAHLLRRTRAFDAVELTSAGLLVRQPGEPIDSEAAAALSRAGIPAGPHEATQFDIGEIPEYDLVIFVEQRHLDLVASAGPPPTWREHARLMREFDPAAAALQEPDLRDPAGLGPQAYDACLKQIRAAAPRVVAELERLATAPDPG